MDADDKIAEYVSADTEKYGERRRMTGSDEGAEFPRVGTENWLLRAAKRPCENRLLDAS